MNDAEFAELENELMGLELRRKIFTERLQAEENKLRGDLSKDERMLAEARVIAYRDEIAIADNRKREIYALRCRG